MKKNPTWIKTVAWTFVGAVTLVDLLFAFRNQHTFTSWEMNPLAILLFNLGGFLPLIFLRLGVDVFGFIMSHAQVRLARLITPIYFAAHLYLLVCYAIIFMDR